MGQSASERQRDRSALPDVVERGLETVRVRLPAPIEWRVRKGALIVIHLGRQAMRDDLPGLSAELSYRFFLALFPFAIFLTAAGGFLASQLPFDNPTERMVQAFGELLPASAQQLVASELRNVIERQSPQLISIGALLALVFATGGSNALIKAMDRTYAVAETRPVWQRYLVALAMTLIAGGGLIGAFVLVVPLRLLAQPIAQAIGLGNGALLLSIGGPLLGLALVIFAVSIAFRIAPNIRLPIRALLPGAALFAISWLIVTFAFSFYVSNFGSYANTYGALGGVVVVLIWFYASSMLLLLGAEVNEVIHRLTRPDDLERRRGESQRESERRAGEQATAAEEQRLRELKSGLIERIESIGPADERPAER